MVKRTIITIGLVSVLIVGCASTYKLAAPIETADTAAETSTETIQPIASATPFAANSVSAIPEASATTAETSIPPANTPLPNDGTIGLVIANARLLGSAEWLVSASSLTELNLQYSESEHTATLLAEEDAPELFLLDDLELVRGLVDNGQLEAAAPADPTAFLQTVTGLSIHTWTARVLVTNAPAATSAVNNWWVLTSADWSGRLVLANPDVSEETAELFERIKAAPEQVAQAYELYAGQALEDASQAGEMLVSAILGNSPSMVYSDAQVVQALLEAQEPMIGIVSLEALGTEDEDGQLSILKNVAPWPGRFEAQVLLHNTGYALSASLEALIHHLYSQTMLDQSVNTGRFAGTAGSLSQTFRGLDTTFFQSLLDSPQ